MDVNENAANQVIQKLTAENLRLTAENVEFRSMLDKKKNADSGGTRGQFTKIIREHSRRK